VIDALATEPHFAAHIRPVFDALPERLRGAFHEAPGQPASAAVVVASYGDHKRARAMGYERIVRMEHGAGQSYAGDPASADIPNYAGGRDADDVGLFLVPGPHPAARWGQRYPDAQVAMIGCPKLDALPRPIADRATVALSFHFPAYLGAAEGDGAFRWYRNLIPQLAKRFDLIGHAHPRHAARIRPWFARAGVPFVEAFEDVCRQAAVYACDNSSTIFEFAATGRPVVLLNGPHYRRTVEHGLRFWEASHVGVHAQPATVVAAIERALVDGREEVRAREHALDLVYSQRSGGAAAGAAAIQAWL
jgi:hypothetical protein